MRGNRRFGIDSTAWAKFDPNLQQAIASLQADPTIELPVMIALDVPAESMGGSQGASGREARRQQAQERQVAFEREAALLVHELEQRGAHNIQLFWINQTVSGRMALPALEVAGRREEVRRIVLAVRQKVTAR